jgi:hypothetical protein
MLQDFLAESLIYFNLMRSYLENRNNIERFKLLTVGQIHGS